MRKISLILACLGCVAINACRTTEAVKATPEHLKNAQMLFDRQQYSEAIVACIDLAREDPAMPGLPELQNKIMERITKDRIEAYAYRESLTKKRAIEDVSKNSNIPDTYNLIHRIKGETGAVKSEKTKMEKTLETLVTMDLPDILLNDFITELGRDKNINIIADSELSDKSMTICVTDTPLREVLSYISRNLGVSFSVGENMIWVTAGQNNNSPVPLETKIYRLRKGLSFEELEAGKDGIGIIETIKRFVPSADGADFLFDDKAHALFVRDSRENLDLIENIINALDVTPPQVLIEARFLLTRMGSLRELGIDWVLNSDYRLSTKAGEPRTIIPGISVADGAVPGASIGTTGKTIASGLTATVQGILTDPQFSAIIYALENESNAETLSVPRIAVVNNKEATIRIGRDFYYYEEWEFDEKTVTGDNNNVNTIPSQLAPSGSPTKEELGYALTVTPSVGNDGYSITLHLAPEVTDFVDWAENEYPLPPRLSDTTNSFSTIEMPPLPVFERRELITDIVVGSGETVVMGGLIDSHDVVKKTGVPLLSKIPIIGRLFMTETVDRESNNLLIFVTATVIAQSGESLTPLHVPAPGLGRSSAMAEEAGKPEETESASEDNDLTTAAPPVTLVEPVVTPAANPEITPVAPPVRVVEPLALPVAEPVAIPPVAGPLLNPEGTPVVQPVVTPVANPVIEPLIKPVVTPVAVPAGTPVENPVIPPPAKPAVTPAVTPVITPVVKPAVTPVVTPEVTPIKKTAVKPAVNPGIPVTADPVIKKETIIPAKGTVIAAPPKPEKLPPKEDALPEAKAK